VARQLLLHFQVPPNYHEILRSALPYAILAPSSHNTQPWLFRLSEDRVDLIADRTRALPVVDPEDRALIISCGAALFHLRMALRYTGWTAAIEPFPEPADSDVLARIRMGGRRDPEPWEELLFQAIPARRTNRLPFRQLPVPEELLVRAQVDAALEGVWLGLLEEEAGRMRVADLIAEGDRLQAADPRFRRELAAWIHPNRTRCRDGMPGYAHGIGDMASLLGPWVVRTFDWGDGQAAKDRQLALGSPVLAVLGTDEDSPPAWLAAGQALSRMLLRLRAGGVWASFLNQPIEVPELRPRLAALLGVGGYPQLLLRIGYGPEPRATPRREVEEVLC
jgi:hypothetical protein